MLIGIALHAALSFVDIPWPVQDTERAPLLGLFVAAVHGFRMPLFFLLSGFFTAMLWKRRGAAGLLKHRTMRIALPFAIGCVTIVPLMWLIIAMTGVDVQPLTSPNLLQERMTQSAASSSRDLWTAAVGGDIGAVQQFIKTDPTSVDSQDPTYGVTLLGWAVIGNQPGVVNILLNAGADPDVRYRDFNAPLHTAAFFGRSECAVLLIDAGSDTELVNATGETPLDSMQHDRATTEFIANLLELPIDFDEVQAGRARITQKLAESFGNESTTIDATADTRSIVDGLIEWMMWFPLFHHLWFLWYLCWLVALFALVASLPIRVKVPAFILCMPLCLVWLVPLTMLPQAFMHFGGAVPGFGPDLSAGVLPMPHVFGYYAIFFFFGALVYVSPAPTKRVSRGWVIWLLSAITVLPVAVILALKLPTEVAWLQAIGGHWSAQWLANFGQVIYVWLMIFGLLGFAETVFRREQQSVRYISDSSYWLYLVHLPLIVVGQWLIQDWPWPAIVKFTLLLTMATVLLLITYQLCVRCTWIGTMLNGKRSPDAELRTVPQASNHDRDDPAGP